jgi:hypothetical protein
MPAHDDELVGAESEPEDDEAATRREGFLDKLRGGGVGTEDPTIVGDVGPTDIPPGTDGDALRLATSDEPVDHLEI